jgi:hypothetical protein
MTRGPDGRTPNGNPTPSDRHDTLPRQTRDWLVLVRGSHHREMTGVGVEEQCALGDRRRCIQVPAVVEADDRFHDRDAPNRTRAMATTRWRERCTLLAMTACVSACAKTPALVLTRAFAGGSDVEVCGRNQQRRELPLFSHRPPRAGGDSLGSSCRSARAVIRGLVLAGVALLVCHRLSVIVCLILIWWRSCIAGSRWAWAPGAMISGRRSPVVGGRRCLLMGVL